MTSWSNCKFTVALKGIAKHHKPSTQCMVTL